MSRLLAYEFLSLDGHFEGPEGHEMDFVTQRFSRGIEEDLAAQYGEVGAFVMGRTTFDSLAGYWPTAAAAREYLVDYMNAIPKLVVSNKTDVSAWPNSEHLGPDWLSALAERKRKDSADLMIIGSASVVRELTARRLIDEYRILLFPRVLSTGRPLFAAGKEGIELTLTDLRRHEHGVLELRYQPTGGPDSAAEPPRLS
ncbi:hypothetical protein BAY61_15645 [Prauserella marina]|uniref:Dihydrofolate reductase n=1 Tax=Prauserella marina TaxID=530584 RepID=A0A222VR34_9PSEU|nr:dihydrofolate reductase family protein [Prauserella marina]ASR36203.1 hypothetical protein BAY61_15645 [Prauserella marina]PWV76957.1 dihydrofolate reductase [Prauserella marina]SDD01130.1 Dihydrofolate reductase [Prauserella marina]